MEVVKAFIWKSILCFIYVLLILPVMQVSFLEICLLGCSGYPQTLYYFEQYIRLAWNSFDYSEL